MDWGDLSVVRRSFRSVFRMTCARSGAVVQDLLQLNVSADARQTAALTAALH